MNSFRMLCIGDKDWLRNEFQIDKITHFKEVQIKKYTNVKLKSRWEHPENLKINDNSFSIYNQRIKYFLKTIKDSNSLKNFSTEFDSNIREIVRHSKINMSEREFREFLNTRLKIAIELDLEINFERISMVVKFQQKNKTEFSISLLSKLEEMFDSKFILQIIPHSNPSFIEPKFIYYYGFQYSLSEKKESEFVLYPLLSGDIPYSSKDSSLSVVKPSWNNAISLVKEMHWYNSIHRTPISLRKRLIIFKKIESSDGSYIGLNIPIFLLMFSRNIIPTELGFKILRFLLDDNGDLNLCNVQLLLNLLYVYKGD